MVTKPIQPEVTYDFGDEYSQETTSEIAETGALAMLNASEINQQIATAKHWPRRMANFRRTAADLITQDEETASMCIYARPQGKELNPETNRWEPKIIKGPSARFAEIIAYAWTNSRAGARIIREDQEFITAQGMFYDLQQNVAIQFEVQRRIVDKDGNRYGVDMIQTTALAACSIALRNSVLKGIPKPCWKGLYTLAEQVIMGDRATLNDRRTRMLDLFKPFGITVPMICQLLGVEGSSEITGEHLVTLQGIITALKDGDMTVEQLRTIISGQDQKVAEKGKRTVEDIKNNYRKPEPQPQPAQAQEQQPVNPPQPQQQTINMDAEPSEAETAAAQAKQGQQANQPRASQQTTTTSKSGGPTRGRDTATGKKGGDDF